MMRIVWIAADFAIITGLEFLQMGLEPRIVDDIALTEGTDFADLSRRALLGTVGGSLRSDNLPVDWLFWVHRELVGSPYAGLLVRVVAACLAAPEPEVREQARIFLAVHGRPTAVEPGS